MAKYSCRLEAGHAKGPSEALVPAQGRDKDKDGDIHWPEPLMDSGLPPGQPVRSRRDGGSQVPASTGSLASGTGWGTPPSERPHPQSLWKQESHPPASHPTVDQAAMVMGQQGALATQGPRQRQTRPPVPPPTPCGDAGSSVPGCLPQGHRQNYEWGGVQSPPTQRHLRP